MARRSSDFRTDFDPYWKVQTFVEHLVSWREIKGMHASPEAALAEAEKRVPAGTRVRIMRVAPDGRSYLPEFVR